MWLGDQSREGAAKRRGVPIFNTSEGVIERHESKEEPDRFKFDKVDETSRLVKF